jgi:hypothetical protein
VLILLQFLLRLAFGLALAMVLTPSKQVTSGFFRNHAYVLLGLGALATLVAVSRPELVPLWMPGTLAVFGYVASASWLYEQRASGTTALSIVGVAALAGAWSSMSRVPRSPLSGAPTFSADWIVAALDPVSSGLLLGATIGAMFLGHWYLNTPTMQLAPLRRLLKLLVAAVALRAVVAAAQFLLAWPTLADANLLTHTLLALQWIAGIVGVAVTAWMAWQTLKIPNTQSATGILYVAVIFTFLGELAGLLPLAGRALG